MARVDFSRESEILDQDFSKLIRTFGGKAAGLTLQNRLLREKQSPIRSLPSVSVTTNVYREVEEVLEEMYIDPEKFFVGLKVQDNLLGIAKVASRDTALDNFYREPSIFLNDARIAKIVDVAMNQAYQEVIGFGSRWVEFFERDVPNAILRSSTTIEDFVDDRMWGTFPSFAPGHYSPFKKYDDRFSGSGLLVNLFTKFFFMKKEPAQGYEMDESEAAGAVFMPWIGKQTHPWHVTAYSGFPEDGAFSYPLIELQGRGILLRHEEELYPFELRTRTPPHPGLGSYSGNFRASSKRDQEDIFMKIKMNRSSLLQRSLEVDRSPPSETHLKFIYDFLAFAKERLGYEVNLELALSDEKLPYLSSDFRGLLHDYSLQLRPVPRLPSSDVDVDLTKNPTKLTPIDATPFVRGRYRVTGCLGMTSIGYGQSDLASKFDFGGPVILSQGHEGMGNRFYRKNPQVQALINFDGGHALSHNHPILGSAGSWRDGMKFYGSPGLLDLIPFSLFKKYPLKAGGVELPCYMTDFPVTLESDGRRGRMLVDYEAYDKIMQARFPSGA